ncbi:hypothetical protein [Cryptosporangium sp. NPDC051539]|uniref:hypothetical protein n=1 Tax=Cryptosporangium sp. NPDC051539 TaxID=3363962 RepID=UPI003791A81B
MTTVAFLSPRQFAQIRALAVVLLPGAPDAPSPAALPDFEALVLRAAAAIGADGRALAAAVEALPAEPSRETLSAFAVLDPASFELVSLLVVGAYYLAPSVLAALRLPTEPRRPAHHEQAVDELGTGLLDAVLERGSPIRTLEDVNRVRIVESVSE